MSSGAAVFFVLVAGAAMVLPVVAVILAIAAMGRGGRAERALKEKEKETEALRGRLLRMEQRLARLEAGSPSRAEEEPPAPPASRPAPHAEASAAPVVPIPATPAAPAIPGPVLASAERPPSIPVAVPAPPAPAAPSPAPPAPKPAVPQPPRERGPGLEERLGARLPVWIGSVALTLAGAYLVKYSFDRGLLSESMRVILGVLFGLLLLGGGEWLRRRSAYVAAGLSAAGIADLYACFLAASNLYHLIPPVLGFALMAATTALAVALSMRHGVLIAVLGLVGGFFTPVLIHTGEMRPGPLFAYLFILEVGLLAVTRQKRWWPLGGLALLSGMAWVGAWIGLAFKPWHAPWVGGFIVASAGAFALFGLLGREEDQGLEGAPTLITWASLGSGLLMMAVLAGADHYSALEWAFLGLLGAGCLVLGRMVPAYEGLAWVSALGCVLLMAVWGAGLDEPSLPRFLLTASALGALFAAGAYACLWGSERPHRWAALSATSAIAYLLVASGGERLVRDEIHWGLPALVLAGVFAALAFPVASRRRTLPSGDLALAALAVAVTAFVSLAVPFELKDEWMTVAWAVEVVALAWVAGAMDLPPLRTLLWPLGAIVAVRLLLNPAVLTYSTGTMPVVNWILYGYGVPALAFCLAAWLVHRQRDEVLSQVLQWGAASFGLALVALEVRQSFHPGDLAASHLGLLEAGTLTLAVMAYALALMGAHGRWSLSCLEWGGKLALGLGLFWCGFMVVLALDPLWTRESVGELPMLNHLLWLYGGPAALALAAARLLDARGEKVLPRFLGVAGIGLAFVLLTLEVRQAFHGAFLDGHSMASSEKYAYSIAWVLFGTVLLVLGIATRGPVLRFASLAVMLLAVGKVFLYDTAELRDLYRVFSLLGLGLSLILLAFMYQRFVFGGPRATGPGAGPGTGGSG